MSVRELHPATLSIAVPGSEALSSGAVTRPTTGDRTPARLRAIVDAHYNFVWRTVRHLGVDDANAEDAAQQVICVLARRLDQVAPGAERAFLFSTALRVASDARRAARRRPAAAPFDVDAIAAAVPTLEELVDQRAARDLLGRILEALPFNLRVVFVLFEIEEFTLVEIAALVGIPLGTAASRLRRARETFHAIVGRIQAARRSHPGGDCR